jgi:hypothetical protein
MAKPFYSLEEVCEKLGKSEDEVRALVQEGDLREFRDAGKVFFKAEDVDKLAGGGSAAGGSAAGNVNLDDSQGDEIPSLADSSSGTSVIGLAPLEEDNPPPQKEDTAVAASGVGVFDDDELEVDADPMAKTQITDASMDDQVQLDSSGSGSGSGLLDLTREADDTAFNAELIMDDIHPGFDEAEQPAEEPEQKPAAKAEKPESEPEPEPRGEPVIQQTARAPQGDASEGVFGGLLVGALLLLALAGSVASSTLQGVFPSYGALLTANFWIFLGSAGGVVVLCILIGWFVGRASAR